MVCTHICSRNTTRYCNVECQRADWKHHKKNVCLTTSSSNNSSSSTNMSAVAATKNKKSNGNKKINNQDINEIHSINTTTIKFKCSCKCQQCKTGDCHCSAEQPMVSFLFLYCGRIEYGMSYFNQK